MILKRIYKLLRSAFILPIFLVLATASAQEGIVIYPGQTTTHSVDQQAGVAYTWEIYDDANNVNFAKQPGNCPEDKARFSDGDNTGHQVEITWMVPGTYFVKVTARDDCSENLKVFLITVSDDLPIARFQQPESICIGDFGELNMELYGEGPFTVQYTDGNNIYLLENIESETYSIIVNPEFTTTYTILSVRDARDIENNETSDPVTLEVLPRPVTSPIIRYVP